MGGNVFENTIMININEYNQIINLLINNGFIENIDFMCPLRLSNKENYGDIDLIVYDTDKFINFFQSNLKIKEIKIIELFQRYNLYSKHLLTDNMYQIDLLKSWNMESMQITKIFYSYSFANIFFKKIINIIDRNLKLSWLGLMCSSNKYSIPSMINYIYIDDNTKLIYDVKYIFELMDLNLDDFMLGFVNEFELLEYFSKSKYFNKIKFKFNSGFRHDYLRLKPFANLVDNNLIKVEK